MQYPSASNHHELADGFIEFFITKIENICIELLAKKGDLSAFSNVDSEPAGSSCFAVVDLVTDEGVLKWFTRSTIKAAHLIHHLLPLCGNLMLPLYQFLQG